MKMKILRSDKGVPTLSVFLAVFYMFVFAHLYERDIVSIANADLSHIIRMGAMSIIVLSILLLAFGYYEVTNDKISDCIIPFVSFREIVFAEYAEIGLVTKKEFGFGRGAAIKGQWHYTDYIYFSPKKLSDAEREDYEVIIENKCIIFRYNPKLHTYLADTLGIELKGKLKEENKK